MPGTHPRQGRGKECSELASTVYRRTRSDPNIFREQSLQMAFIHRDNVVQQVSSAAFDPTLRHTVLPGALEGGAQVLSSWIERPGEPPTRISHPGRRSEIWAPTRMETPLVAAARSTRLVRWFVTLK